VSFVAQRAKKGGGHYPISATNKDLKDHESQRGLNNNILPIQRNEVTKDPVRGRLNIKLSTEFITPTSRAGLCLQWVALSVF